ncbi:MAG: hypothetical protein IT477_10795 [Rhodanobacteraceae bacterium]|nr:hypothetical protein [Rhodanobacteraceae bacterium]
MSRSNPFPPDPMFDCVQELLDQCAQRTADAETEPLDFAFLMADEDEAEVKS